MIARIFLVFAFIFPQGQTTIIPKTTLIQKTTIFSGGAVTPSFGVNHFQNPSCSTTSCSLNVTWPSGTQMVLVQMAWNSLDAFGHIWDCPGSSACGSSTDTLVPGQACTQNSGGTSCSYYICVSALASGASTFTLTIPTLTANAVYSVYAIVGAPSSGCYDTGGTSTNNSVNTGTVTTSGNIATSSELVVATTIGSGAVTAGTGYTLVDNLGSKGSEVANVPPSSGSTTTATFNGGGGGNWTNVIDAIK